MLLFLAITVLAEYIIVIYAIALGVRDTTVLQWGFLAISPMFHLVPIAVIIALPSSWTYLTKHLAVKPFKEIRSSGAPLKRNQETKGFFSRVKSGLLRVKGISYLWQRIHFARATTKSALTVLLVFLALISIVSLLVYPRLITESLSNLYQNNPAALNFVRGSGQALASIGAVFSPIYNGLVSIAPSFKGFASAVGGVISPLANLDNAGKYLIFQNAATWILVLSVLVYGQRAQILRSRKARRS